MKLKYDLSKIPDFLGATEIDPGRYLARLQRVQSRRSSTGNPMLVWHCVVRRGKKKGTRMRSYTSLLEHALGNLKQHLQAFGLKGRVSVNTDKLLGKNVTLIIGTRTMVLRSGGQGTFPTVLGVESAKQTAVARRRKKRQPEYEDEEEDEEEGDEEYEEYEEDEGVDKDEEEEEDEEEDEDEDFAFDEIPF